MAEQERSKHESLVASSPCKSEQKTSHHIQSCDCEPGCQEHCKNSHENVREDRRARASAVLVVGHYCHDRIKLVGGKVINVLGGSASYILKVLDALSVNARVVSKVGPDFRFLSQVSHPPLIVVGQHTTQFYADYTAGTGEDRVLRAGSVCGPILSADIPSAGDFSLGLAVGVAGEITFSAIERMLDVSKHVIVDLQALIRRIDPATGDVSLQHIRNTPFHSIVHRISFLKATRTEAAYIDLDSARQITCVLVTDGKHGSTVYRGDMEHHIQPFATQEVDPTGAGDCFLAGFVAGLYKGFPVEKAAQMGNYFGALAVGQIGIPQLQQDHMQDLRDIFYGIEEDEMNCNPETADRHHTSWTNSMHPQLKN